MAVRNRHTRQNCRYLIFNHLDRRYYLEIGDADRAALRRTKAKIIAGKLYPPIHQSHTTLVIVNKTGYEFGIV